MIIVLLVAVVVVVVVPFPAEALPTMISVYVSPYTCYGEDNTLSNTDILLTYGDKQYWPSRTTSISFSSKRNLSNHILEGNFSSKEMYLFEQMEHGGGNCNCVRIEVQAASLEEIIMCEGSASIPRRKLITKSEQSSLPIPYKQPPLHRQCNNVPYIDISFVVAFKEGSGCNTINAFNEGVEFSYQLSSEPNEWVPTNFIYFEDRVSRPDIFIGDIHNFSIRGYRMIDVVNNSTNTVHVKLCGFNSKDSIRFRWLQTSQYNDTSSARDVWILDDVVINLLNQNQMKLNLLDDNFSEINFNPQIWPLDHVRNAVLGSYCGYPEALIFGLNDTGAMSQQRIIVSRGLITTYYNLSSIYDISSSSISYSVSVSNISPTFISDNSIDIITLRTETINPSPTGSEGIFDTITTVKTIEYSMLDTDHIYQQMSTSLMNTIQTEIEPSVSISLKSTTATSNSLTSKILSIAPSITPDSSARNTTSCPEEDNMASIMNYLISLEANTKCKISSSDQLTIILNDPDINDSLRRVERITMRHSDIDVVTLTYLLGVQVTRLSNSSMSESLAEEAVNLSIQLLTNPTNISSRLLMAVSTTLLTLQDNLLAAFPYPQIFQSFNIVIFSRVIDLNSINSSTVTAINSSDFSELIGPLTTLTIPVVLLRAFDDGDGIIQLNSAIYRNVSSLFSYQINESSILGPDIVASSIQCGRSLCNTNNYILNSSFVTITFEHSQIIKNRISFNNMETSCVFLEIMETSSTILKIGEWSDRGCTKNLDMSSDLITVCECNHLTHFGILLSPKPPKLSPPVKLSLSIINYIGVAVSMVAMSFTVLTFIVLKSLHSMRNYIHVNLCISLALGQILFVAGVDRTGSSENDSVPVHCQVIAVFLHYFFLVSFMWMLMEGVILYLALVQVFVKNKRYYVIAFTCVSYGLPILYMGFLSLPLGFGLSQDNYGHERECFLNASNHFIWAIIAPFIVIFVANVIFFLMTARIMWQQQLKQIQKSKHEMIRGWLRSAVSLLVIMSLTWIIGILVLEVKVLLPLVYIYTIMVALQGFFIFLIFVVFSNSVREAYAKWWRSKINKSDWLNKHFQKRIDHSSNMNSSRGINLETKNNSHSSRNPRPKVNIVSDTKTPEKDRNGLFSNDYSPSVPEMSSLTMSNMSLSTSFNSVDTQSNFFTDYTKRNDI